MTPTRLPARLKSGDHVRIIAPSLSLSIIAPELRAIARARLEELGLRVSFGAHVEESDEFASSSIESRVEDLHDAFADESVDAILTVIGGYNANQLLPHINWSIIRQNPKIFCGYSDITILSTAIFVHTGLITYSGPHYSSFGMLEHSEQTVDWFVAALFDDAAIEIEPAASWSDDAWFLDQKNRHIMDNEGHWVMQPGSASGRLIGGNLCTFALLHGTHHMPDLAGAVLFIEDDEEAYGAAFDRDLTALSQQPGFENVRGLIIGRFQQKSEITRSKLAQIIGANRSLADLPVIANMDFGHTDPMLTIPVGGTVHIAATSDRVERLTIEQG